MLLGPRSAPSVAAVVSQTGCAGGGNCGGSHGSGVATSTMSTLTGLAAASQVAPDGWRNVNPTPIPDIVSIMTPLRAQEPGVDMYTIMRSQNLLISDVGIGGRGQRMDLHTLASATRRDARTPTSPELCRLEKDAT
ncbi:hypothetical protein MHU86_5520 [Fragilaria crotonensis]|nr:hypothetical protein MHU86_5520 [Fragilaria crotonensis]